MKDLLVIKNLYVKVEDHEILKDVNLTIHQGEKIALLGPNGNGKSSLLMTIMGHPKFIVTKGTIFFNKKDVLKMSIDARSKIGLFLGFQNPCEIDGVVNSDFLKNIMDHKNGQSCPLFTFYKKLKIACRNVGLPFEILNRYLNKDFSGGEKKRNEILQMLLLEPKLAMLDEIDSGLDVDAIKKIATIINQKHRKGMSVLIISHYMKLLNLIKPSRVVVMIHGHIVLDGGFDLITLIDKEGYEKLQKKYENNEDEFIKTKENDISIECIKKNK